MRSVTIAVLLATAAIAAAVHPLDLVEDLIAAPSSQVESTSVLPPPPVKLDKNLRRALLKALVDLEAESAEQQQQTTLQPDDEEEEKTDRASLDESRYDFLEISRQKSATFAFDGFPSDEDIPSEDKLQNSSFVETEKYVIGDEPQRRDEGRKEPPKDYTKGVQVHHIVRSDKASAIYEVKPEGETLESVESRSIGSTASSADAGINVQKSVSSAPITETLQVSASGNIASAAANSLDAPRPTAATPSNSTLKGQANSGSKIFQKTGKNKEDAEDVKIFQAPLVAAFTVQQDERGIPKSVVPLYKNNPNAAADTQPQPLSLQEQLEFKQRLLEKQLAQLQAQQIQQTEFLLRQRHAYEEQVRQKHQQEYFLQEHRRLKQEQEIQQQRILQQQQQQQRLQQQFVQAPPLPQRLPQPNFQQQLQQLTLLPQPPQPQAPVVFKPATVQFQPSLSLEVPSAIPAPPFTSQPNILRAPLPQQQLHQQSQQLQQHQQQQQQQQLQHQQQQQQQQQQHQQQQQQQQQQHNQQQQQQHNQQQHNQQQQQQHSQQQQQQHNQQQQQHHLHHQIAFQSFPSIEFQQPPAATPLTRFNRQEAFGSVGNFGFNNNNNNNFQKSEKTIASNTINSQPQTFVQQRFQPQNNFLFNSFRPQQQQLTLSAQQRPPQFHPATPARQIQDLLFQSGIAGDLQSAGTRNQEDLNIVSKVLALNVGAIPNSGQRTNGFQQQQQQQQFGLLKK